MGQHDRFAENPAQIEARLAQERAILAANMQKLRVSMMPDNLLNEGATFAMARLGPLTRSAGRTVRNNPAAAGLVAAGLGWLILGRKKAPDTSGTTLQDAIARWEDEGGPPAVATGAGAGTGTGVGRADGLQSALPAPPSLMARAMTLLAQHPCVTGAIALAAGVALARALPQTQTEHRVLGPERDRLFDHVQHLIQVERARMKGAQPPP